MNESNSNNNEYLISLVPFFLVGGDLTKIRVVFYTNNENLSFRIYTVPIEDVIYLLSLLLFNFSLYKLFSQYGHRKKIKADGRDG
jgi:hypothetical protein